MINNFLNPEGHKNSISASKVTAILPKGWILPIGGASVGKGLRLQPVKPACLYRYTWSYEGDELLSQGANWTGGHIIKWPEDVLSDFTDVWPQSFSSTSKGSKLDKMSQFWCKLIILGRGSTDNYSGSYEHTGAFTMSHQLLAIQFKCECW